MSSKSSGCLRACRWGGYGADHWQRWCKPDHVILLRSIFKMQMIAAFLVVIISMAMRAGFVYALTPPGDNVTIQVQGMIPAE
ncbi:hypothetical protein [Phaeobacter sp. C3_T13_0]|uniref:hypothetical protein n=1 Tax=Phaeobacter cretensis TaxID=3342641 RepID=UPI0039BD49E8